MAGENASPQVVSRFWQLVNIRADDECWHWLGYREEGYGKFYIEGRMVGAHELALSFSSGEKRPEGFDTCHSCDNPICVNPLHLRFDTRQSNVDDMFERGRSTTGEASPNAKLTVDLVWLIRTRRANGARQKDLAEQYGMSAAYISEIVNGLVWQHAGGPITGRSKRTQRTDRSRVGKAA